MSTEPSGKCFISYRRTRLDEIKLLVEALHEMGIPTWQDITDLASESTPTALQRIIEDPAIASALLWITRDVAQSPTMRRLEAPGFLNRAKVRDGFFIEPVCADGLDYHEAGIVVDPDFTLEDVPGWNLHKVATPRRGEGDTGRIDVPQAAEVSRRVLRKRLSAIHAHLPAEDPLLLALYSRSSPPKGPAMALALDWQHRFSGGRHAGSGDWDRHLLPALHAVSQEILAEASDRRVLIDGLMPLAAAAALGTAFLQPLKLHAAFRQESRDGSSQDWSLAAKTESVELVTTHTDGKIDAKDVSVLVSVTQNVEPGFARSRRPLPEMREVIHIHGKGGKPFLIASPGQARACADYIIGEMLAAREHLRIQGNIHLFLAGPAGLAFLVGQLCNAVRVIQTYEYDPEEAGGVYRPAALLKSAVAAQD